MVAFRREFWLVSIAVAAAMGTGDVAGSEGELMSYGEARAFLAEHTRVVELVGPRGARVAICPGWQGRVMTSTCGRLEGLSFGFINGRFVEAGAEDPRLNNYGGEDRMWLSPEGGPFSLWFQPAVPQTLDHWYTPPALNQGAWEIVSGSSDRSCRMVRRMSFQNASATDFVVDVTREVRLLSAEDLRRLFGPRVAGRMTGDDVQTVAYETINTVTNRGDAWTKAKGLVSIWMLGMLNASPETVVVVPYKPGSCEDLGPVVQSDYFGPVPDDRLKILPEAVLFRADGRFRSKIGTSQQRATNRLGSIDFRNGVLTLVQFTMPEDPCRHDYMNNRWGLPQPEPYVGDVANSYNDGPPEPGKEGLGAFYEIESLSRAVALKRGESLAHHHRTLHIQADGPVLAGIARELFGVDLDLVRRTMLPR